MPAVKSINIRFPFDLWRRLRRLQEEGRIASIQAAVITAVTRLADELEGRR